MTTLDLNHRLNVVRRRSLAADAMEVSAHVLMLLLPLGCAMFGLDYWLDFGPTLRAVELAVLLAAAVFLLTRSVWPAIRRSRSAYHTALLVESRFPQLRGLLVSSVQLQAAEPAERRGVSEELIRAMSSRILAVASMLPLKYAVDLRDQRRLLVGGALCVLLAGVVFGANPAAARTWILRTVAPFGGPAWPRHTRLYLDDQAFLVKRGGTLVVSGRIAGRIPQTGELRCLSLDSYGREMAERFDINPNGVFKARFGPVLSRIRFAVAAGDAISPTHEVTVITPPELTAIRAVHRFPSFTGRAHEAVLSGDVRAMVGTRVDLYLSSDRPVEKAWLAFANGDRAHVTIKSRTDMRANFLVARKTRYQILLFDKYDFCTDSPPTFEVDPTENGLPTVTITRPRREHAVSPATRLRITYQAEDDFGVRSLWLRFAKDQGEESQLRVPLNQGEPSVSGTYEWDLAGLDLEPGQVIHYYAVAADEGMHLAADPLGRSQIHVLKVLAADRLGKILDDRVKSAFSELEYLVREQSRGLAGVSGALVALPIGPSGPSRTDVARVRDEQGRQIRVQHGTRRIARELRAAADELAESFLADSNRIEALRGVVDALDAVGAAKMAGVIEQLRVAREALVQCVQLQR